MKKFVIWCEKGPQSPLHTGKETKVQEQGPLDRHVILGIEVRALCTVDEFSVHSASARAHLYC